MDEPIDDDLARAIEASLKESSATDPEEARFQTELQAAIEESKKASKAQTTAATHVRDTNPAQASSSSTSSFLSQRAQDERARLERLKRRRPDIDPSSSATPNDPDEELGEVQSRGAKRQHISSSSRSDARRANAYASASSSNLAAAPSASNISRQTLAGQTSNGASDLFWDGELRQTGNKHVDPLKDTRPVFTLTDILSPRHDIEFAIVSAFCWNFPWIYGMFAPSTPVIAVDHSTTGDASIKAILPNWVRTTPFLRNGFGCMHMKFMLLFYKSGRLRVVVSTANLVEYDWRDIENTVWVQDIPKHPEPVPPPKLDKEDFASVMVRVLHALNVAPALINMLRNEHPHLPLKRLEELRSHWDFSRVKTALVPSIAGKFEGWPKVILTGHTRLMKALIDMGASTPQDKELLLECQGSSIGTYSTMWMNEFYRSARGESTQSWLDTPKSRRAKVPYPPVKILFPTAQYVRESVLGEAGGGTMFCRRKQWEAANFPRELFHQTRSKRGRVLMHSKMILATFRDKQGTLDSQSSRASTATQEGHGGNEDSEPLVGWVYVGSHNFTPSAWGTLSGSGFNPTLNVNNYELGIVIPLRSQEEADRVACWERPPPKYVLGRDEPWMQTEPPFFAEGA
ncbi:tyrosyl-DNA phosphodiesterase-domain-containing protein [Trametes punicea]|nr:tyrosyl-DNA phosphodiesterase-domain-containing protein [Trametes punicea]